MQATAKNARLKYITRIFTDTNLSHRDSCYILTGVGGGGGLGLGSGVVMWRVMQTVVRLCDLYPWRSDDDPSRVGGGSSRHVCRRVAILNLIPLFVARVNGRHRHLFTDPFVRCDLF